jgi:hypothetical protein
VFESIMLRKIFEPKRDEVSDHVRVLVNGIFCERVLA